MPSRVTPMLLSVLAFSSACAGDDAGQGACLGKCDDTEPDLRVCEARVEGRGVSATQRFEGGLLRTWDEFGGTRSYEYEEGRISRTTHRHADGRVDLVTYAYDEQGRRSGREFYRDDRLESVETYEYLPSEDWMYRDENGDGTVDLTQRRVYRAGELVEAIWQTEEESRLSVERDGGRVTVIRLNTTDQSFSYDEVGRLWRREITNSPYGNRRITFTYDGGAITGLEESLSGDEVSRTTLTLSPSGHLERRALDYAPQDDVYDEVTVYDDCYRARGRVVNDDFGPVTPDGTLSPFMFDFDALLP